VTPLLEARGVGVDFSTRAGSVAHALDGVDLVIRRAEVVAVVGESGSGKTTLARALVGLQSVTTESPATSTPCCRGASRPPLVPGSAGVRRLLLLTLESVAGP
jgi:peptide/nickel transport system ATP-binding protein